MNRPCLVPRRKPKAISAISAAMMIGEGTERKTP
jgi:hypothetical protein